MQLIDDYKDKMPEDVRAAYDRWVAAGRPVSWSMRQVSPDESLIRNWVLSQAGTYIKYESHS